MPPPTANDAGAHALVPATPHTAGFVILAFAPYGRPFAAAAGDAGGVSVSGPFSLSAKLAVLEVPTGADWFAVSDALMLTFGDAGKGPAPVTLPVAQLYVVPVIGHVQVPGAEVTVALVA